MSFLKHNYGTINPEKLCKEQIYAWIGINRQKWLDIHRCLHNKANIEMRPNDSIWRDATSPSWEMTGKNIFSNKIFFPGKHYKCSHCPVFHAFLSLDFYFFLEHTPNSSTWELQRTLLLRCLTTWFHTYQYQFHNASVQCVKINVKLISCIWQPVLILYSKHKYD